MAVGAGAIGVTALSGCSDTPDPDEAVRSAAMNEERALIATYDTAIAAATGEQAKKLQLIRDQHAEHLTQLGALPVAGKSASPSSSPAAPLATGQLNADQLATLESEQASARQASSLQAVSEPLAMTLALIAGSEQMHASWWQTS